MEIHLAEIHCKSFKKKTTGVSYRRLESVFFSVLLCAFRSLFGLELCDRPCLTALLVQ